jgi:hypothetical protein
VEEWPAVTEGPRVRDVVDSLPVVTDRDLTVDAEDVVDVVDLVVPGEVLRLLLPETKRFNGFVPLSFCLNFVY